MSVVNKRVTEKPLRWIGIWIAIGGALGVPFENIPLGIGIGTGIGVIFVLISYLKTKYKQNI